MIGGDRPPEPAHGNEASAAAGAPPPRADDFAVGTALPPLLHRALLQDRKTGEVLVDVTDSAVGAERRADEGLRQVLRRRSANGGWLWQFRAQACAQDLNVTVDIDVAVGQVPTFRNLVAAGLVFRAQDSNQDAETRRSSYREAERLLARSVRRGNGAGRYWMPPTGLRPPPETSPIQAEADAVQAVRCTLDGIERSFEGADGLQRATRAIQDWVLQGPPRRGVIVPLDVDFLYSEGRVLHGCRLEFGIGYTFDLRRAMAYALTLRAGQGHLHASHQLLVRRLESLVSGASPGLVKFSVSHPKPTELVCPCRQSVPLRWARMFTQRILVQGLHRAPGAAIGTRGFCWFAEDARADLDKTHRTWGLWEPEPRPVDSATWWDLEAQHAEP